MLKERLDEDIALVRSGDNAHTCTDQSREIRANDSYISQFDRIEVNIGVRIDSIHGQKFVFNVLKMLEEAPVPDHLVESLRTVRLNVEPRSFLNHLLTETIEGQLFLEWVVSTYTEWTEPLNLERISASEERDIAWYSDYAYVETIEESSVFDDAAKDEIELQIEQEKRFSESVGLPIGEKCSYVLRLKDELLRDWLYVGDSTNILGRLSSHYSCDGDFSKPDNVELHLLEVQEVREDVSEYELYVEKQEESEVPSERILGGQ